MFKNIRPGNATSIINSVLGALATAAHTGAVDAATTVMGYIKQLVTDLIVVDGYFDVPTADATADATVRDVVGRKTDAAVTTVGTTKSIMAYVKGLINQFATLLGYSFPRVLTNTFTFVTGTTGAVGNHTVFTITGCIVLKNLVAYCTVDVTEAVAGATIALGVPNVSSGLFRAATDAETITARKQWITSTKVQMYANEYDDHASGFNFILSDQASANNIVISIATQALSGGTIIFIAEWYPLSADGNLVAATPA